MALHEWNPESQALTRFERSLFGKQFSEEAIHNLVEDNPSALLEDETFLIIGREVGNIDLLALDKDGNTVIIEFKKERTPRDILAQVLEYAAWVANLSEDELEEIAEGYIQSRNKYRSLDEAFRDTFLGNDEQSGDAQLQEEQRLPSLNGSQRFIIVAETVIDPVERVVSYLQNRYRMDICCVELTFYEQSGKRLLDFKVKGPRLTKSEPPKVDIKRIASKGSKDAQAMFYGLHEQLQTVRNLTPSLRQRVVTYQTPINNRIRSIMNLDIYRNDKVALYFYTSYASGISKYIDRSELVAKVKALSPEIIIRENPGGDITIEVEPRAIEASHKLMDILREHLFDKIEA